MFAIKKNEYKNINIECSSDQYLVVNRADILFEWGNEVAFSSTNSNKYDIGKITISRRKTLTFYRYQIFVKSDQNYFGHLFIITNQSQGTLSSTDVCTPSLQSAPVPFHVRTCSNVTCSNVPLCWWSWNVEECKILIPRG